MVRSRRASVAIFSLFLVVGLASACKEEEPRPPVGTGSPKPVGGGDTEGGPPSTTDAGDAGFDAGDSGVCTALPLTGLLVDRIGVSADPPVSTGGVLVDGSYDLTLYTSYVGAGGVGGPTGLSARSTIRIGAGDLEQIIEISGSAPATTLTSKSSFSAVGSAFASTELCPNIGAGKSFQYTATDTQLVLTDPIAKEAFTFVKR